ncbi:Intraflagellar transport protein 80 [Phytophthora pseudosyringae]|uniref:Intraflagellar transport protein 80 n=1 Tax=Phytophthora pseudosyringae TaxID=221518 RepID=A0A8T1W6V3_9STRA|nr:Intraflagellar transport protein 80 [Phytophthora pseudosyringae]
MRLQHSQLPVNHHTEIVTACCWTPESDVITCSDDNSIVRWRMDGEVAGAVTKMDAFVTSVHWVPSVGKQSADTFAVSCTDGTFRLISKNGREEKRVQACDAGAVIALKWNYDGTALVTAGEDGTLKIWSRSGNLRSTLATTGRSVYDVCWGPDSDQLLFMHGNNLVIKTVQLGRKDIQWKAHDGSILCLDWSPINNRLISGGEDRIFRVWDAFGRQLYQSPAGEHVVTSISWCPNGSCFAVGSYNMLRLCDQTGWSYCRQRPQSGSLMDLAWASDSTQLVAAGGNGATVFAQVVGRMLPWKKVEVTLVDPRKIHVHDVVNETLEELDFARDRVVEMSFAHGFLVVCTATQCFIYDAQSWNTPHIFDLRAAVSLLVQSESHFLTVDNFNGIQVYSYEGKTVSNPKFPGLHVEFLSSRTISLSSDTLAILDHSDRKTIRCFDLNTGKQLPVPTTHSLEILELSLSRFGPMEDRKLFLIDRNRDMYLSRVANKGNFKLHAQVDSAAWNDASELLIAIADAKLLTWTYPNMVYVDRTLLPDVVESRDAADFLKMAAITSFVGSGVTVRRADGTTLAASVSPYAPMLYEFTTAADWDKAARLCRFVKSKSLWTCLAGMALHRRHLETAEIALASIDCVDKLYFVLYVKSLASDERRNAELALYSGNVDEAEAILLQAHPTPLVYRAIKLNLRLFRWERALDLAIKHTTDAGTHVDTVLAYRERFLAANKLQETDKKFLQYSKQVAIDWETISKKKELEREKEQHSGGGSRRK